MAITTATLTTRPKTCFRPLRISATIVTIEFMGGQSGRAASLHNTNRLNWLSALYGPTLSSTQMLPDSCAMVNTSLSWVSESPTKGMHLRIINRGLSNFVT